MYNIIMYLTQFCIAVGSCFSKKLRKMWRGERVAIKVIREKIDPNAKYVWFHAASLGEFEQGRPLIERVRKEYPEYKILLTFFSPSGYEVCKNYAVADIVTYLPIDTIINARAFLRAIRPVMAFFIKYEFWYNYLHILQHRGIPTYSVSSIFRPEQVFFKWYGGGYSRVLNCFTHLFVQNEESKQLLNSIGVKNSTVVGDTRFDRVLNIKEYCKQLPIIESFIHLSEDNKPKVFVAGSSWQPDESVFLKYFNTRSDWKLIIAPHVINENHIKSIKSLLQNKNVVCYTQTTEDAVYDADVLIIDCFGLLSSVYRYGDITYVGGGFGVGIHNVLEAAVWGKPVVFGPNNKHFIEAQGLKRSGGGFEISDISTFSTLMERLEKDTNFRLKSGASGEEYVASLAGASDKVLSKVKL